MNGDRGGRLALYAALTLVVWGLFALDRGLWHDDVQSLFRFFCAPGRGEGLFLALGTPTRRLRGPLFALALATGYPRQALELLLGLTWLLTGIAVDRIARELSPQRPAAAFLAACLTLTATADAFTNTLVGLVYFVAALAYVAGLWCGLAFLRRGGAAGAAAVVAVNISLWTAEAALPAWLLTPCLWWLAAGRQHRRRFAGLAAAWYASAIPYLFVLWGFLRDPHGYAAQALVPLSHLQWLRRWLSLMVYNFEPWRWAVARPHWFAPAPVVIPLGVRVAIAGALTILFAALLWRRRGAQSTAPGSLAAVAALLLLMAASNAGFAGIHLAEYFCRTHILSRVFAALALALLLDRARSQVARLLAAAVAAAFLMLGILGGLERQDYLAGHWRWHRQELRSVLDAAPALAPDTRLLLRVRTHDHYMATDAGYLARAWMSLAYADPTLECRVFLWSEARDMTCRPGDGGLVCGGERSPDCRRLDGRDDEFLPYSKMLFFEYQPAANRFELRRALPADAAGPGAGAYAADVRVLHRPPSALAANLVYGPGGLADRWWPW